MRHYFIGFFCFVLISIGFVTSAQEDTTCPDDLAGYLPPRVVIGELARVTNGTPLNLRPQPGTSQARIGVIPAGTNVDVLDGARCTEDFVWWQVAAGGEIGWVAEGSLTDDEYYLEPRAAALEYVDENGVTRQYIRHSDGFIEHIGCARPPEDYTRIQQGYATLNNRTVTMLENAQRIYESMGRDTVNFRQAITQGSYNPGGVSASFGTHDGGGAVDISVRSIIDWSVLEDNIEPMIEALRIAGFAAWLRDTGELYPNSPIHIHAIAVGDAELSPIARDQIDGTFGYLRGYDGLPHDDGIPTVDRHGGAVLCKWMIEDGWVDLREDVEAVYTEGITHYNAGRIQRAIQTFSRAIELDPKDGDYWLARGDVYYDLGLWDDALTDYVRYESLVGDSIDERITARINEIRGS